MKSSFMYLKRLTNVLRFFIYSSVSKQWVATSYSSDEQAGNVYSFLTRSFSAKIGFIRDYQTNKIIFFQEKLQN